jgi:hypothetical protein
MKTPTKKLSLAKTTLRTLSEGTLSRARGGFDTPDTGTCPDPGT